MLQEGPEVGHHFFLPEPDLHSAPSSCLAALPFLWLRLSTRPLHSRSAQPASPNPPQSGFPSDLFWLSPASPPVTITSRIGSSSSFLSGVSGGNLVFLLYRMRRVDCKACGVIVEQCPGPAATPTDQRPTCCFWHVGAQTFRDPMRAAIRFEVLTSALWDISDHMANWSSTRT